MSLTNERFYALDALRAIMLLLGIVLHACVLYFPARFHEPEAWYFYDQDCSSSMVVIFAAIHVYRMPVFFVLAGFFFAMLLQKRGLAGVAKNRFRRVAMPLAAAVLIFIPTTYLATRFASQFSFEVRTSTSGFGAGYWNGFHYLWFLWHLIIIYTVSLIAFQFSRSRIKNVNSKLAIEFTRLIRSRWSGLAFVIPTTCCLVNMNEPGFIDTSYGIVPLWQVIGLYSLLFGFGWGLFYNRSKLDELTQHAWLRLAAGMIAVGIFLGVHSFYREHTDLTVVNWSLASLSAVAIWLMVQGCLAVSWRCLNRESGLARYVSDSSYWVYLAHLPVVIICGAVVSPVPMAAEVKCLLTITLSTSVCLSSYHVLVRDTMIGQFLNGRRYPSSRTAHTTTILQPATNAVAPAVLQLPASLQPVVEKAA